MLFSSPVYIFAFLPFTLCGYFLLNLSGRQRLAKAWLVLASLFFYGYWNVSYLGLILGSMLVNFMVGKRIHRMRESGIPSRGLLALGIVFNLGLLAYFKYTDFFVANVNTLLDLALPELHLVLPLAISFFTFQQIAYLVDCLQSETHEYDLLSYALFVSFFPQLIAGPIVHHREMMPQFSSRSLTSIDFDNLARGLLIFAIGLFKKVVIADTLAVWADAGFSASEPLGFLPAWGTSLSYSLQLYYDFSGYSDMAIGAALLFNIRLPFNFDSPYKAVSIQDFWRRWHMTLSRWLRDYLYIPLGGNRRGRVRVYLNLMITFVLGGLWHGAGWTFVLWGFLHGAALCIHRLWQKSGRSMPKLLAWFLTLVFVNVAWVFFRAEDLEGALMLLSGMLGMYGTGFDVSLASLFEMYDGTFASGILALYNAFEMWLWITIFGALALYCRNSLEIGFSKQCYSWRNVVGVSASLLLSILLGIAAHSPVFLYFNF